MEETLDDRLSDFIFETAWLMEIPQDLLVRFADEMVSSYWEMSKMVSYSQEEYIGFALKIFPGTIEYARTFSADELRADIGIFAQQLAHIFILREGALKDPEMKDIPLVAFYH